MPSARSIGPNPTVLCVGELLWDALPDGLFLGGAPFNVACHLRALGEEVAIASRVGNDLLGSEALRRLENRGLDPSLIQVDETRPTGLVRVAFDASGEPDYEIVQPAAWDGIVQSDALLCQAGRADALVFGSLAQRATPSRETIQALWEGDLLRVFDINLRPPFVDPERVQASLHAADVVKLNNNEIRRLAAWFDLSDNTERAAAQVAEEFRCAAVCVTSGAAGAGLWMNEMFVEHPGYEVDVADTVGAGDAFLAALISGLAQGLDAETVLDCANRLGAYVASRRGAVPSYAVDGVDDTKALPLDVARQ